MKKKLLVVGDSFMVPDSLYKGQHWSEMLPEYEILLYSVSGSSNGIIATQFYSGLAQIPDAVVLGFTESNRIDFEYESGWITGANKKATPEQKLLADMFRIHASDKMLRIKDCTMVLGLLTILESKKIPYAWTMNQLFNNISQLPYPSDPWVNKILGKFFYRMTATNLATYPKWKADPGFHTHDAVWQNNFANEVKDLIQSIDFLPATI